MLGASANRGTGQFHLSGESQSPKLPFSHPCPQTLFPSAASLVDEICSSLRLAYPAGKGSEAIRPTMLPNSRRVRWLSANSSQQLRACLIKRPPVFTSRCAATAGNSLKEAARCCKLVSDHWSIPFGSTNRRPAWRDSPRCKRSRSSRFCGTHLVQSKPVASRQAGHVILTACLPTLIVAAVRWAHGPERSRRAATSAVPPLL